jgi:asparagine synthase (glutamine-hydrolysing)
VERQLVSDVPLGCFLSGGIDSSVIALAMKRAGQDVFTFSIGFSDKRYDETQFAAEVADHLKTSHRRFTVRPDAAADLIDLARVFGEPFGDSSALPTHYLSRETRRHVKVALSGDGGDELFGGYDRYRAMHLDRLIRKLPMALRTAIAQQESARIASGHPKSKASRLHRLLSTLDQSPAQRYSGYLRLFSDAAIAQLLREPVDFSPDPIESNYESLAKGRDLVAAALATDRITYLPDDLLTKLDRASMLHGLEVRSPFMDHELVSFAAGLTSEQLIKGGPKRMLREAFAADLPDFVFKRKKMGFAVPIGDWFRGELRPMLRDHLFAADSFAAQHFNRPAVERLVEEHEQQRADHSQRLYALLMLELWWKTSREIHPA